MRFRGRRRLLHAARPHPGEERARHRDLVVQPQRRAAHGRGGHDEEHAGDAGRLNALGEEARGGAWKPPVRDKSGSRASARPATFFVPALPTPLDQPLSLHVDVVWDRGPQTWITGDSADARRATVGRPAPRWESRWPWCGLRRQSTIERVWLTVEAGQPGEAASSHRSRRSASVPARTRARPASATRSSAVGGRSARCRGPSC